MNEITSREQIAVIAPANLKYVPYIQNYLNILKTTGVRVHVLSWDKRDLSEPEADLAWHHPVHDSQRLKMLLGHWLFARKCRSYIRRNRITKLVVLTAAPAFFLGIGFLKKFTGKYILDIRDDSPLVRRFPKTFVRICSIANQVVSSSPKFKEWIPAEALLCHNADVSQIQKRLNDIPKQRCSHPISLIFAGMLNEGRINLEMLRHMGHDPRFRFAFIGSECPGKDTIKQFSREQNMENILFRGTYSKDEIYDIYREHADLVNIIRAKNTVNRNALPNKLYDAVLAGVPVVVFDHNEAVSAYVRQYSLGLVLEENMATLADTVAERMAAFNYHDYYNGRLAFLNQVLADMEQFQIMLESFSG